MVNTTPMIPSQSSPSNANPTTDSTTHTMIKITSTVHMLVTIRLASRGGYG